MIYVIDIDYGKGLTPLMDFNSENPDEDLKRPAGEFLALLLQLCPTGITLEINRKGVFH